MSNNEFPLMTSNNEHGDTATQGFNDAVEISMDSNLATDPSWTRGQRNNGTDVFASVDWDPNDQMIQMPDVLEMEPGDHRTNPHLLMDRLRDRKHAMDSAPHVKIVAPNEAGAFGFYWNAPSGSINAIQTFQVLTQDPHRYRVKLHPWVASGSPGVIWIGSDPGNVQQAASNNLSLSAYPLTAGNSNTFNEHEFFWNDDMWASLDVSSTVGTYLFVTVERYT